MAFYWGEVGCVKGEGDLRIDSVSLHAGGWGLVVSDWGIRDRQVQRRFPQPPGAFTVRDAHQLSRYGFGHAPLTGRCPARRDQLMIVLARSGPASGGTPGVDLHFTNGTTTWLPIGMGVCRRSCDDGLDDRISDAFRQTSPSK